MKYGGIFCIMLFVCRSVFAELKPGDTFPDLKSFKVEGTLPETLKGKTVFVDFWASWCTPCKESFPVLNELTKKYSSQGLVIIGVNLDETKADMEHFLKAQPASFVVVRDASETIVKKLGIRTFPSSFILDGDGKVRFIHSGFHGEKTKKQYIEEIESLLGK
jgi:thiol-disulfide isomerase/thioredoxin